MSTDQMEYFKAKYQTLEDLPGVGVSTAEKLKKIGFKTVEALATAPIQYLTTNGIGKATAEKIVAAARKSMALEFITAEDLHEIRKKKLKMTTGCRSLDNLFEGGLETQSITEFHGDFGSGKSQVCQQLAVTVQLPEDRGGLDGACLYIDTENTFRPERVIQIAETFDLDPSAVLKRIIYAEAYTSDHQTVLLEGSDEIIKENGVRLIVVDSLTGHFRSEFLGREVLAPRQGKINQHMHKLIRLARAFNAVAIITNQMASTPDSFYGKRDTPIGGHIVGHIAHTRVELRKGRNNLRIAKIIASPFLPDGEAPMRITGGGVLSDDLIEDVSQ